MDTGYSLLTYLTSEEDTVSVTAKETATNVATNSQPSRPAAERILEAAKSEIDERGVLGFRVLEVSEKAKAAVPLIYRHFGGRNGLVAAALADQFESIMTDEIERVHEAIAKSPTLSIEELLAFLPLPNRPQADSVRWKRLSVMATARELPELQERLSQAQMRINDAFEQVITEALTKIQSPVSVNPRALSLLFQSVVIGFTINDLDSSHKVTNEEFADLWFALLSFAVPNPK
jgi:AcrR family transcriptional regulator